MAEIKIKSRYSYRIIISGEYESIKDAIEKNRNADLRIADLRGAHLEGANLEGADLRDANLRDSYLGDADLKGAHLEGADLKGAHLEGANLEGAVLFIQGSKNFFQYYNGYLKIGCISHSLEYWLIMYDTIGIENNYTEDQIKEYKKYMDMCKDV